MITFAAGPGTARASKNKDRKLVVSGQRNDVRERGLEHEWTSSRSASSEDLLPDSFAVQTIDATASDKRLICSYILCNHEYTNR
jgi:hypothetical protein